MYMYVDGYQMGCFRLFVCVFGGRGYWHLSSVRQEYLAECIDPSSCQNYNNMAFAQIKHLTPVLQKTCKPVRFVGKSSKTQKNFYLIYLQKYR